MNRTTRRTVFDPNDEPRQEDDPWGRPSKPDEPDRKQWAWGYYQDNPDATPEQEQIAWTQHLINEDQMPVVQGGLKVKPKRPDGWTRPEPSDRPRREEPVSVAEASLPTSADAEDWNRHLSSEGHAAINHDPALRRTPRGDRLTQEQRLSEIAYASDELGVAGGITFDEAPMPRHGRGRATDQATAIRVDGQLVGYKRIGRDTRAIEDWLTRDGRRIEDYAPALARGRKSEPVLKLRQELSDCVKELRDMGALQSSIAEVLGCRDKAIRALSK